MDSHELGRQWPGLSMVLSGYVLFVGCSGHGLPGAGLAVDWPYYVLTGGLIWARLNAV
jgi:hypothetical protein